jgi:predicted phosphodiesterase
MKIAFIADVHGNLEAFTAVCASLKHEQVDRVIFLGDIVGYGANPNECIELLQTLTENSVAGNHDWAASTDTFNSVARDAIAWTCAQLSTENKQFLMELRLTLEMNEFFCVHATPYMPEQWRYAYNACDAEDVFLTFMQRICFIAHTHCPAIFVKNADTPVGRELSSQITLHPCSRYIINCGSVGQPRDGDPRASYGILDDSCSQYYLVRVDYDVASVKKKILQAGLPDFLAHRISFGR